jgi:beta-lactamase regulating signal transducer with metallopeptidase domain
MGTRRALVLFQGISYPYPTRSKVTTGLTGASFGTVRHKISEIRQIGAIIAQNRHCLKIWLFSCVLLVAAIVIHLFTFCRIAEFAQPPFPKEPFEI